MYYSINLPSARWYILVQGTGSPGEQAVEEERNMGSDMKMAVENK